MLQFCHQPPEVRRPLEPGVVGQQRDGRLARLDDRALVAEDAELLERAAETRLRAPQHVALATLLEVDPAELETVSGGGDGMEPLARRAARLGTGDQQAQSREAAAAHPAAELMELRDA